MSYFRVRDVPTLPSWSWVSIAGGIRGLLDGFFNAKDFLGSLVDWNMVTEAFQLRSIISTENPCKWPVVGHPVYSPNVKAQQYLSLALAEGCIETDQTLELRASKNKFGFIAERMEKRWPTYGHFRREVFRELDQSGSTLKNSVTNHGLKYGLLFGRVQVARFKLRVHHHSWETYESGACYGRSMLEVVSDTGEVVGLLDAHNPKVASDISPRSQLTNFEGELIALSVGARNSAYLRCLHPAMHSVVKKLSKNKLLSIRSMGFTYYDSQGEPLNPAPTINVMLIRRNNGLAHRITIGWMLMTKWAKVERHFETIVLA